MTAGEVTQGSLNFAAASNLLDPFDPQYTPIDTLFVPAVTIPTGLDPATELAQSLVYPIPFEAQFYISPSAGISDHYGYAIYDLNGQLLYQEQRSVHAASAPITALAAAQSGVYLLLITYQDGQGQHVSERHLIRKE
mgnify:CR=1 FL=1